MVQRKPGSKKKPEVKPVDREDILKFHIVMKAFGMDYRLDLGKELGVNETELSKEFAEQSAKFAYWGSMKAWSEKYLASIEEKKDVLFAELCEAERTRLGKITDEKDKPIKVTETMVKNGVITDSEYKTYSRIHRKAQLQYSLLKVAVKAFEHRKDMLISIGATNRKEMDSQISILRDESAKIVNKNRRKYKEDDEE